MDDLADQVKDGFARADGKTRDLRGEVKDGFARADGEFRAVRGEIATLRAETRKDIGELRVLMVRFGIGLVVCLVGLIATLIGAIVAGPLGG
jgi:hypothetical protein